MAFQDLIAQFSAHDSRGGGTASAGPVQYHLTHQPPLQQHQHPHPHQHAVFHGHQPPVEIPRKRPLAPDVSTQTGRLLQPRPPNPYPAGDPAAAAAASTAAASSMLHQHQHHHQGAVAGPAYIMSPTLGTEGTSKKRRGRPTKAEAQARAAEAAARGEPYPPPKTGKRASMASALSSSSGGADAPGAGRSAGAGTRSPGTPGAVGGAVGGSGTTIRPEREHMSVSSMMTAPAGERGLGESGSAGAHEGRERERRSSLDVPVSPRAKPEVSESDVGVLASPTKAGAQAPEGRRDTLLTQGSPAAVSTTSSPGEERGRETPREASEEHKRRATPHSFKDTVGI
ncbi:uncharacterized protein BKCO1_9700011 [Diplodia corticola]|uniref:Uncharacterized protein n=1 Tax=Diplodia corticola TaxID=236234 RepID=A0A1J9RM75_9PEZI|nr:uncharacterized protein BKCO1_9700011 [Diplodia corticola]OJD29020.1 hypothetical protein BKCO1_9700011 [Diplodia corticola]